MIGERCRHAQGPIQVRKLDVFRLSLGGLNAALDFTYRIKILGDFFAIGRPKLPMAVSVAALMLHVALSASLIFGLLGLPQLGIRGAALATVLVSTAQAGTLASLIFLSARSHARLPLRLWFFLPSRRRLRKLIRVGLPNGVHECVEIAIWSVAIVILIGQFGSAHLAAAALMLTLVDALYAPIEGFGGAMTALVGRDIGRGRLTHAQMWTRIGLRISIPFVVFASLACLLIQGPLLSAISASSEVRTIANQIFAIFPLVMVSFALIAVYDYALVGAGDTLWPAISHLSANLVFLIGGGAAMVKWFPETGSFGVWSAAAVALVFVAGLFFLRWRSGYWRTIDLIGETV